MWLCSRKISLFICCPLSNINVSFSQSLISNIWASWYLGTFCPAAFIQLSLECIGMSDNYCHFNAHKQFPSLFTSFHSLTVFFPHIFSPLYKSEVVNQAGSLNILNITVPQSHLSNFSLSFHIVFPSYPPFYSIIFSQEVDVPDRC